MSSFDRLLIKWTILLDRLILRRTFPIFYLAPSKRFVWLWRFANTSPAIYLVCLAFAFVIIKLDYSSPPSCYPLCVNSHRYLSLSFYYPFVCSVFTFWSSSWKYYRSESIFLSVLFISFPSCCNFLDWVFISYNSPRLVRTIYRS